MHHIYTTYFSPQYCIINSSFCALVLLHLETKIKLEDSPFSPLNYQVKSKDLGNIHDR